MKNRNYLSRLLFFAFFCLMVNSVSAQKITKEFKSVALKSVLKVVEQQSGLSIIYKTDEVNENKKITEEFKDASVESVLSRILDADLEYKIQNKMIIISRKAVHQQKTGGPAKGVTRRVVDKGGEPIIGASVKVKGGSTGTVTDIDGNFTLNATPNATLVVSFIGFKTQEVSVANKSTVIVLDDNDKMLEEVVVVGYGTQKKSSMTAAVASISAGEISKQVSSNVASALQGRTPGVEILQQSGVAGADVNIVIRGAASFGATEPLYVIDGAFSNSGLSSLNQNDIESIEVLKDGSAAAIYGSRAANGVVLITTKQGKKGTPKVQIDASYAFQKITNVPDFLNASEWRAFANTVADNSGLPHAPENDNPTYPGIDTDWTKEWIQYAPVYNLNGSISGGSENATFNTSLGYYDQTGMTIYSGYKKYNFRLNSSYKKGIFSLSENLAITHKDKTPTSSFKIKLPTLPIYDAQGRFTSGGPDYYINPEDGQAQNPIAPLFYTERYSKVTDVLGGINAGLDLYKGLKYKFSFSGNYSSSHDFTHTPEYYSQYNEDGTPDTNYGNPINSLSETRGEEFTYTIDNILTFNRTFSNHTIDAMLGTSWMREFDRIESVATISDLGGTAITGVSNVDGKISTSESNAALLSYFARLNYDYSGKYLLSLSLRRDESSKFHKDNRVGYFPSVSAGWNAHMEEWFENPVVSKLKLRASYGELGANFLNPYNFDAIAYGPIPYTLGGVRYVNGRAAYLKSKDLKWETAKTTDIGIELGFLNNDLTITADYFYKKNIDLLAQIDLNLSSGQVFEINSSREKPYVNSASVENKGFEFLVNYRKQLTKDFNLDATFNISTLENKVLSLGKNVQPITAGGISSFFNDPASITRPGDPIGSFYGYKIDGFDADGNFMFTDTDNNGIVNANDKVILGSPIPDFSYGLNLSMGYKDFDLTMFFQGVYGNEIFNATRYSYYFDYSNNKIKDVLNAWSPTNMKTNIPVMKTQNTNGGNSLPSEFYIEDGSYFRMKNLQLGYTLPKELTKRLKLERLRLYAGVQNVFTITNYSGYDPEVSSNALFSRGIDSNSYPNARTFTFGFNLTF